MRGMEVERVWGWRDGETYEHFRKKKRRFLYLFCCGGGSGFLLRMKRLLTGLIESEDIKEPFEQNAF